MHTTERAPAEATATSLHRLRVRWAAIGAAIAVTLGAGTIATVDAVTSSGERAVYTAITPCRLIDTRPGDINVGPKSTPLGPGSTETIAARGAQGQCTAAQLPNDAVALALNATALNATADGFLTFWPNGPRPLAASLNPSPGQPPAPNAVTTDLAPDGTFRVYNENGTVDLVLDVIGYYTDHNHDDRYYTKTEIDSRAPQQKTLTFAGASLNISPTGTVTLDPTGEGLRWQNSFVGGPYIETLRPNDWDGVSDVTLRIDFFRTTGALGIVQFWARPDSQNPGDDVDTGTAIRSTQQVGAGMNLRRQASVTLPAERLNQGDLWKIGVQRITTFTFPAIGHPDEIIVSSMSLIYTAAS